MCSLAETALASASIAQVHKAVLRPEWAASASYGGRAGQNWTTVAVKVRHKTIAETLKGDLTTLRAMLGWQVRWLAPFCLCASRGTEAFRACGFCGSIVGDDVAQYRLPPNDR